MSLSPTTSNQHPSHRPWARTIVYVARLSLFNPPSLYILPLSSLSSTFPLVPSYLPLTFLPPRLRLCSVPLVSDSGALSGEFVATRPLCRPNFALAPLGLTLLNSRCPPFPPHLSTLAAPPRLDPLRTAHIRTLAHSAVAFGTGLVPNLPSSRSRNLLRFGLVKVR